MLVERTIVHLIELDHLDDRLLLVVLRVLGFPPPQNPVATVVTNQGLYLHPRLSETYAGLLLFLDTIASFAPCLRIS